MKNYLIIFTIAFFFACSGNKAPKGILSEEQMTPVLVELHLADAIFAQRYALAITRENYQEDLYLSILKKYKLDQKVFENSVLYYGKHPDQYRPIYDEVLNRLNEMNVKSRAKDSIQSIKMKDKIILKDTTRIKEIKPDTIRKDSAVTPDKNAHPVVKDTIRKKVIQ